MNRFLLFLTSCATALSLGCAQSKHLTILHTNDMHASFMPHAATWSRQNPKPLVGGFTELAAAVESLRTVRQATLLLDAGDLMTGNPVTDIRYQGGEGGALYDMMNMLGYDVATAGNHDFDISAANFVANSRIARYPMVSCNLVDPSGQLTLNMKEYVIVERGGLRVGIIGVMSNEFYNLVNGNSIKGIKLLPQVATLQPIVDKIDPATDLIVVLSHAGVDEDSVMASQLKGVDVIVGGHSHTRLKQPKQVNGILIVQAGANAENLGILDLTVENDGVTASDGKLLQLWYNSARPKTRLSLLADSVQALVDLDYKQEIGTLKVEWKRGGPSANIGNFLADAQRIGANADVAFMNLHGVRKDVPAGPLTKRDLFEVLPFRNILCTFPLTGKQIREIVVSQVENGPEVHVSGIDCEWRRNKRAEVEIVKLLVNGVPVDEERTYVGAGSDYMMGEARKYLGITVPTLTFTEKTVFGVAEELARKEHVIQRQNEDRIRELK